MTDSNAQNLRPNPLWPAWVNLLVPGFGLVLAGQVLAGVILALAFAVAANLAVAAALVVPDEVPLRVRGLAILVASVSYILSQFLQLRAGRRFERQARAAGRRQVLRTVQAELLEGRIESAWAALEPLASRAEDDLLIALRVAQVLSLRDDAAAARGAWQRLRRLDRHRLYRREIAAALEAYERKSMLPRPFPPTD